MRRLTIFREKSFVACIAPMKVYIEDPYSNDIEINGVSCRFLGKIKNGEQGTFYVGECSARVFVIADGLSKDYCNDFYRIPEGCEDIFLTGKNKFNPAAGNAFRFDNNFDPAAESNRKSGKNKGIFVLAIALIAGMVLGIAIFKVMDFLNTPLADSEYSGVVPVWKDSAASKKFSDGAFNITLTKNFTKTNYEGFTVCFDSERVAIFALEESMIDYPQLSGLSLKEYAETVIKVNGLSSKTLQNTNGLYNFYYYSPDNSFIYYGYVYQDGTSFWFVQFAVKTEYISQYKDDVVVWAKSVYFN